MKKLGTLFGILVFLLPVLVLIGLLMGVWVNGRWAWSALALIPFWLMDIAAIGFLFATVGRE